MERSCAIKIEQVCTAKKSNFQDMKHARFA